jgi:nucleoside-diphosphate-sugar epimerase
MRRSTVCRRSLSEPHDDFGFAPEVSLADGLKSFINWHLTYARRFGAS